MTAVTTFLLPKVLYVLKRFPRLSETFVLHEMVRLEQSGVEIGVESIKAAEIGPRHPEVDDLRAKPRYLPASGSDGLAGLIAERVQAEGFRHIHAHFATSAAELALAAGRRAGVPVTVTCHAKDIFHRDYAHGLARRLAGATGLVTVSDYNRRHLQKEVPGVPVHLVYNAIEASDQTHSDLGGPVLCIARLVEKKGIDLLIRAAGELTRRGRPIRVDIVGEGPNRPQLESLVGMLGLTSSVRFHGALTSRQVDAAYRRASMFVLPCRVDRNSDRDGLPTVLGEAMLRRLPVISTDLVGIPELIRHGETGLLAPPDSHLALAEAIEKLCNEPDLARDLAVKGAAHAGNVLDPVAATDALIQVFAGRAAGC